MTTATTMVHQDRETMERRLRATRAHHAKMARIFLDYADAATSPTERERLLANAEAAERGAST